MWLCGMLTIGAWLAALTVIDLRCHRLPNVLTLPGAVAVLLVATFAGHGPSALAGGLTLALSYLVVHLVSPAGLGAGDVKLALGLGALAGGFGAQVWLPAALGAPLLTAAWGLLSGRRVLPHGPAMCVVTALALLPVVEQSH
jgi:leader peptidase (prepilin peptidase)/N-methyltransferase